MRTITTSAALLLLVSCGPGVQEFVPAEKLTARAPIPDGYAAAEYDLQSDGRDLGEAKVWSKGAYRATVGGNRYTVVELGFEIENELPQPLALQQLELDSLTTDNLRYEDRRPARIVGVQEIPPGDERQLTAYFFLPPQVNPNDVEAFRVEWAVGTGQLRYDETTPFLQQPEPRPTRAGYYYTPFYDPFVYDGFHHPGLRVYRRPFPYRR